MKIAVGTLNKGKIEAVQNGLMNYSEYKDAEIIGTDVNSSVSNQPIGLEETIRGAKNRARLAYESLDVDLAFGLESGIFPVPETKSGYMDTTVCAIYDGQEFNLGMSSCFEYPKLMIKNILEDGKEVSDVAVELGFANDRGFREGLGMVGFLTRGIISRKKYSEQAVHTAMIHLLNKAHY